MKEIERFKIKEHGKQAAIKYKHCLWARWRVSIFSFKSCLLIPFPSSLEAKRLDLHIFSVDFVRFNGLKWKYFLLKYEFFYQMHLHLARQIFLQLIGLGSSIIFRIRKHIFLYNGELFVSWRINMIKSFLLNHS